MKLWIFRRLIKTFFLWVFVVSVVFLLIRLLPGDPVALMIGESADLADQESIRQSLGLASTWGKQYFDFWKNLFHGWGISFVYQISVFDLIVEHLWISVWLTLGATSVSVVVGLLFGIYAGMSDHSFGKTVAFVLSILSNSIPVFVLGPVVMIVFSLWLNWFPVSGYLDGRSFVLPCVVLGWMLSGQLMRLVQSSVEQVKADDFVRTAKAKGLGPCRLVFIHILPNALPAILTAIIGIFGGVLSGALVTETLFDLPGLGRLLFESFQTRDFPLIQGIVLWIAFVYSALNLVLDLCLAWLDPRVRLGFVNEDKT